MFNAILIMIAFVLISFAMIKRIIPTILALPLLAIVIAVIAQIPFSGENSILTTVVEAGISRMYTAAFVAIMGAWLGEIMMQSGISKRIIRFAAELGGDKPFVVITSLSIATALIFTTIGGLGGTIMIGTITVPIMMSFGMSAVSASGLLLLSMATGIAINLGNWVVYADATGVSIDIVQQFTFIIAGLTAIAVLAYIIIELRKVGNVKQWPAESSDVESSATAEAIIDQDYEEEVKIPKIALISPIVPLILVIAFDWPIAAAFLAGIIYAAFSLLRSIKETINLLSKSAVDGAKTAAPAILLLIGIGMLLNAVMHPNVQAVMNPLLSAVIPSGTVGYILFFIILAPLALYRGPLNLWGLGSGILAMIIGLNLLSPAAGMGALLATERVQVVADPTNSHNVWIANFAGTNVNDLLKKLLPYAWAITAVGVIISAIMFM